MTYSIVAYDRDTEAWGVAVASKFLAVGAIVPWARSKRGAIATQARANVRYGIEGIELLATKTAKEVINILTSNDPLREERQVGIVDRYGNAAAFTGRKCIEFAGHLLGDGFSVQGNILASEEVIERMAKEFETSRGKFYEKLIRSLEAGENAGGDKRGKQSAAILVVKENAGYDGNNDIMMNLRVDDSKEPLKELRRLIEIWEALFLPEEMIDIKDYEIYIKEALRKLNYDSLEKWININNFEMKYDGKRLGKSVLKILLKEANIEINLF
ncbi:MAG: DUF1028 domain-containing protein [Sulfolobaceae archaeon]